MSSLKCLQTLVHSSTRFGTVRTCVVNCTSTIGKRSRGFQTTAFLQSKINQNSWAADRFEEMGIKLPPGETLPETRMSTEALYSPSEKVLKLSDEFLSLNMVECVQLISEIQVLFIHQRSLMWMFLKYDCFATHRPGWANPLRTCSGALVEVAVEAVEVMQRR